MATAIPSLAFASATQEHVSSRRVRRQGLAVPCLRGSGELRPRELGHRNPLPRLRELLQDEGQRGWREGRASGKAGRTTP